MTDRLSIITQHARIYYAWLCESNQVMVHTRRPLFPFSIEDMHPSGDQIVLSFQDILSLSGALMTLFQWAGAREEQEFLLSRQSSSSL